MAGGHARETGGQRLAHRMHHLVDGWSRKDRRDYEQDQFPVRHAGSCYLHARSGVDDVQMDPSLRMSFRQAVCGLRLQKMYLKTATVEVGSNL